MKLHHIAIWTFRLEELKEFYVRFLGGKSNEKYVNPKKGFESYFISFKIAVSRSARLTGNGVTFGTHFLSETKNFLLAGKRESEMCHP